jgi:ATP/maltotriose-dependent transcriptional regulator MalT
MLQLRAVLERLERGFHTTLLAQWLSTNGVPAAWLSLEPADNEPTRFLAYVRGRNVGLARPTCG